MAIKIIPADHNDAPRLVPIGIRAFKNDELHSRLENLEGLTPAELDAHMQWRIARNVRRMAGPDDHWYQAVDTETGEPLGFTGILAPEKGKKKGLLSADVGTELPACINREVHKMVGEVSDQLRKQHMGDRDDFWCKFWTTPSCNLLMLMLTAFTDLCSMAVDPKCQGRGIGKQLLAENCKLADQAGQDIYLESTSAGKKLYLAAGFEPLGEFKVLDGAVAVNPMLRKAKVQS